MMDPTRVVGPRRHQERGVVKAGGRRIVGLGVRPVLDLDQRYAAGAEPRLAVAALLHRQPQQIAIVGGEPLEVARDQADDAIAQRRAAGEGGRGGWIGRIHSVYIG